MAAGLVQFARFVSTIPLMYVDLDANCRFRWGYDLVTGYKHKEIPPEANMTLEQLRKEGYLLDDKQWLQVSPMYRELVYV